MAKTSPTKLFIFFIFFASVRLLDNLAPISAIVDHRIPHNSSSGTGADPCQKDPWKYAKAEVRRVEGNCDESDMASFANAVTCTREFLLDRRPYHAASFVYKLHRHNAGKFAFFAEALLAKLDLNPMFIDECRRKDREMVLDEYHGGLDLLLEELDRRRIFEERSFCASEEDEHDYDDNVNDDDEDVNDDDEDEESDQDIEANFFD